MQKTKAGMLVAILLAVSLIVFFRFEAESPISSVEVGGIAFVINIVTLIGFTTAIRLLPNKSKMLTSVLAMVLLVPAIFLGMEYLQVWDQDWLDVSGLAFYFVATLIGCCMMETISSISSGEVRRSRLIAMGASSLLFLAITFWFDYSQYPVQIAALFVGAFITSQLFIGLFDYLSSIRPEHEIRAALIGGSFTLLCAIVVSLMSYAFYASRWVMA